MTMFSMDIVSFTDLCASLSAAEVLDMIAVIFSDLDLLCEVRGVEKIVTIGDAYIAACGAPEPVDDHALRICSFSLDVLNTFRVFNETARQRECDAVTAGATVVDGDATAASRSPRRDVAVRIGVHTGKATGAIVGGSKRFRFDMWGAAHDVAQQLEASGVAGCVQVSPDTFAEYDSWPTYMRWVERPEPVTVLAEGSTVVMRTKLLQLD